ncbi:MAG TPA: SLC13 family permease [Thermoanaerobaculia bacterium]
MFDVALVLALLALGVVLFSLEVLSVDVVTLLLLIALILGGILTPAEAFAGFASELVLTLAAIFVLSGALQQTGAVAGLAERLERLAAGRPNRLLLLLLAATGAVSSVINNTTATAVFLPPGMAAARRLGVVPSRFLMPIAFASILGGTCTLIGTSTNLAVSGFLAAAGEPPLGLFELAPVGLVALPIGIAYLLTAGRRLLPDRGDASLTDTYAIRHYLSEVRIGPGSPLAGQRVYESELARRGFRVLEIHRGGGTYLPDSRTDLEADDLLLVQGPADELVRALGTAGVTVETDLPVDDRALEPGDVEVTEVLVSPQSDLLGRTLEEARFHQRFGVTVLAIHRGGHPFAGKLARARLRLGDLLLVQGTRARLESLRRNRNLWPLDTPPAPLPRPRRGLLVAGALVAAVATAGAGWLPLSVAFLGAAVVAVVARAITVEEAYKFVEWRLIVLIGGMTAFGTAMDSTGAARLLAHGLVAALADLGPLAVLTGFALLTIALTQPMSNAAAALVVLPVALASAAELGVSGRPFAIAIALAASLSFITPLEPSCLLVYGPGKYRFADFARLGAPLTLVLLVVVLALVPRLWPF